jgi:hypothetical protein
MESNRHNFAPVDKSGDRVPPAFQKPRRGPRKLASIPIWLRNEARGPIWEEETETDVVSRFGAGLHCRHSIGPESVVVIIRKDSGQRAYARVKYSRYNPDGNREVGIEFIDKDDFWELDWDSAGPGSAQTAPSRTPAEAAAGEPDPDSGIQTAPAGTRGERLD